MYATVEKMRAEGVEFLDTPDTYFDVIDQRVPNHGEDVPRLAKNKILIDADPETHQRKLLQIFTTNAFGPIFFEIIQRTGNEGFGEGNFQALFESIERRSEEHTSELQSLMRTSYTGFCLKKKQNHTLLCSPPHTLPRSDT